MDWGSLIIIGFAWPHLRRDWPRGDCADLLPDLFRERVTVAQAGGIVLSLAGVLTIIAKGSLDLLLSLPLNWGDLLIFVAVVGYATYSALLRKRPAMHPLSFLAVTFGGGTGWANRAGLFFHIMPLFGSILASSSWANASAPSTPWAWA